MAESKTAMNLHELRTLVRNQADEFIAWESASTFPNENLKTTNVKCYLVESTDSATLDFHVHPLIEHIKVLQGTVQVQIGRRTRTLKKGDTLEIKPQIMHKCEFAKNTKAIIQWHP